MSASYTTSDWTTGAFGRWHISGNTAFMWFPHAVVDVRSTYALNPSQYTVPLISLPEVPGQVDARTWDEFRSDPTIANTPPTKVYAPFFTQMWNACNYVIPQHDTVQFLAESVSGTAAWYPTRASTYRYAPGALRQMNVGLYSWLFW